ncbi:proton extrusion protein PcxA [Phormidium sp. CLA17]|uniref:proton extrusion protein PcxA n=1 Tax=Leptolyngbya sp. Cla-17 TaxID=2803751 RepID=UPI001492A847|nr:proton extrusion protein PcxA [Leptolyngbya sp. Cla-17]MBM0741223.1 proton extrusion protein PcxA [Leptolyngbya sp. Cla-17]
MRSSFLTSISQYLQGANQWLLKTPERALEQAYEATLMIKAIEDQHFDGEKISKKSTKHSENVLIYFQSELNKYLKFAEVRLTEFRASRVIVDSTNSTLYNRRSSYIETQEQAATVLEKLAFIDQILDRYKPSSTNLVPLAQGNNTNLSVRSGNVIDQNTGNLVYNRATDEDDDGSILDKTGVLPRSILGTLNRIKRDLDPNSEEQVVQTFRFSKAKTLISIRLILLLIIVPLLTQQISKAFIVGPLVDRVWQTEKAGIFLNSDLESEAMREFNSFRERLEFNRFLGTAQTERLQENTNTDTLLKEKAEEIAEVYSKLSARAVKNVFSDLLSAVAFAIVLATSRRGLETLKSFIDETVYGLSDSAKAFIIILFTDMFVGFHSPHGWEVLLEGLAKHFGLPPNQDFNFLFIATFPVILDTVFKYWIFRYLNRISPSAVATYKNMNE